jgi:hypothetical protein
VGVAGGRNGRHFAITSFQLHFSDGAGVKPKGQFILAAFSVNQAPHVGFFAASELWLQF